MSGISKYLIVVTGPTASGKTDLAIQLAQHFQTEIINADSRQCYRELKIGVAAPTEEQLAAVPHHFIQSHSIHETVTAATFEQYALQVLERLFVTHNVVVLTGGTGLYIKALCEGMDAIPPVDPHIRNEVQQSYALQGIAWLQQQLQMHDSLFAEKGEMQNPQRMMRALEVVRQTGRSIRSFHSGKKANRNFQCIYLALDLPREQLYQRINQRVDHMMQQGLLEEARQLYPFRHLNALQTVGYQELFAYFDNTCTLDEAVAAIKTNTRRYAKRQLTWLRHRQPLQWFAPQALEAMLHYIQAQMQQPDYC